MSGALREIALTRGGLSEVAKLLECGRD